MKKIINAPETVVSEMCHGFAMAHPDVVLDPCYHIIRKKKLDTNKVTLICGGGSGHEPAHAGFVGEGLLDAAVCGDVFASPSQIQVYQAIRETRSDKGTLLIVKNYSGDMMNFTNAMALAQEDGIPVDYVRVDDDIAVQDSLYTVGRRGVAGTVLVHKIAGAAARRGMDLAGVKAVAEDAAAHVKSLGFALTSCTVPAKGTPTFALGEDEMEFGVGIHGEPGVRREKLISADELAARMVPALLAELPAEGNEQGLAVLVNGFGGTPLQELYLLANSVGKVLRSYDRKVERVLVGNYLTSIDMAGASFSLMGLNEERKELLNDPCSAPALTITGPQVPNMAAASNDGKKDEEAVSYEKECPPDWKYIRGNQITMENLMYMVDDMSETVISHEVPFCELDSFAGDGDFGMSVAKGFRHLKREWQDVRNDHCETMGTFLDRVSMIIMEHCGGASGPIWGSAFRAASKSVGQKQVLTVREFADMMQAAADGVYRTGERSFGRGAVVGDKTLMDALRPCADRLAECADRNLDMVTALRLGAEAAVQGAEHTKSIVARMGRAGTVGQRSLGYADAGAYALGVIFTHLCESVSD